MLFNFFYLIILFTSISLVIVCMHVQVLRSVHLLKNKKITITKDIHFVFLMSKTKDRSVGYTHLYNQHIYKNA